MMRRKSLAMQRKERVSKPRKKKPKYDGDVGMVVSTGSTQLDLAISGNRVHGGGIPMGILVEVFGPSGVGKTVLLCEIAGNMQRMGGDIRFGDPEARLNEQFAKLFGFDASEVTFDIPNTVTEAFLPIQSWEPESDGPNGVFEDSLAALSTNLEMDDEEGDKMGMRRAKEFSEQCRKTCRVIQKKNLLMVCSNQVRQKIGANKYEEKYVTPGGEAVPFYSSLRLQIRKIRNIKETVSINGKKHTRVVGVEASIYVYKSSVDKPYRDSRVFIIFDYGIDDVRANLIYLKQNSKATTYTLNGEKLGKSITEAIQTVEKEDLEDDLREAVIELWEEIESKFETARKPKRRW